MSTPSSDITREKLGAILKNHWIECKGSEQDCNIGDAIESLINEARREKAGEAEP